MSNSWGIEDNHACNFKSNLWGVIDGFNKYIWGRKKSFNFFLNVVLIEAKSLPFLYSFSPLNYKHKANRQCQGELRTKKKASLLNGEVWSLKLTTLYYFKSM